MEKYCLEVEKSPEAELFRFGNTKTQTSHERFHIPIAPGGKRAIINVSSVPGSLGILASLELQASLGTIIDTECRTITLKKLHILEINATANLHPSKKVACQMQLTTLLAQPFPRQHKFQICETAYLQLVIASTRRKPLFEVHADQQQIVSTLNL